MPPAINPSRPEFLFLAGGGECGALMRALNWSATPLGVPSRWPDSLRTAVRLALDSRFPTLILWGTDLVMLYNDDYRELIGNKHPDALGRSGREVFSEIWDIIGPMIDQAYTAAASSWSYDRMLLLERNGYPEECYFTWSFSPIRDAEGKIGGVCGAGLEKTVNVIDARQLRLLRRLAAYGAASSTAASAQELAAGLSAILANDPHDLPFTMLYQLDSGASPRLAATSGFLGPHPAAPSTIARDNRGDKGWPLQDALNGKPRLLTGLEQTFDHLPSGPWAKSPASAYIVPINIGGEVAAILIAGLNPHRNFDHRYREFIEQVSGHIGAAIANSTSRAALNASRERLTLATTAAEAGVFQWDAASDRAIWENDRMYEIFGRSREDGPLPLREFLANSIEPADAEAFVSFFNDAMRRLQRVSIVARIRRKNDGATRWVQFDSRFARSSDGRILQVGIAIDVTDRKLALEALEASENRYRTLVEASPEGILMYRDGRILFANRAASELMGASEPSQVIGRPIMDFVCPENYEFLKQREERVLTQGAANPPFQQSFIRLDGSYGEVETVSLPYHGADGSGIQILMRDISAQRRHEREREESLRRESELRRQAEQANQLKDEFLATVSHELRNPLNAIAGWAHLLQTGKLDTERSRRAVDAIVRNAHAQAQIVSDLLDVSRIVTGKMELEMRAVDLREVLEHTIMALRPAAESKRIVVESAFDAAAVCNGDPERLQQVFWNLLSNAIKFTPEGGRVQIKTARAGAYAEVALSDTGIGISREMLPFIFDRFRQADAASSRKFGGLGLGLAIARDLVELHSGTVSAFSDGANKGSLFTVRLPLAAAAKGSAEDGPEQLASNSASDGVSLGGVRVLVVDDETDAREMIREILSAARAEVRIAASAPEARSILENWQPDVMVADIGMPGEDGYAMIQRLRMCHKSDGEQLPAVALTAYARREDRARALAAGFNLHLSKPVQVHELLAAVAALARR